MTHALVTNQELRSLAECGPSRVLRTYMGLMDDVLSCAYVYCCSPISTVRYVFGCRFQLLQFCCYGSDKKTFTDVCLVSWGFIGALPAVT
jgi:hypothetical protein